VIRYVLVVALAVAILGLAAVAIDHGTAVRGETELESALDAVDEAAVDLHRNEDLALAGNPPPQRVVEVDLPGEGYTSEAPDHVTFERAPGENLTHVAYRFPGRAERSRVVEAPLARAGEGTFGLGGYTGRVTLFLRLVADDDGRPVVSLAVRP
jgi:hypothetical protein